MPSLVRAATATGLARQDHRAEGDQRNVKSHRVDGLSERTALPLSAEMRRWSDNRVWPGSADLRGAASRQLSGVQRPWRLCEGFRMTAPC
jgi:hypothetical protein